MPNQAQLSNGGPVPVLPRPQSSVASLGPIEQPSQGGNTGGDAEMRNPTVVAATTDELVSATPIGSAQPASTPSPVVAKSTPAAAKPSSSNIISNPIATGGGGRGGLPVPRPESSVQGLEPVGMSTEAPLPDVSGESAATQSSNSQNGFAGGANIPDGQQSASFLGVPGVAGAPTKMPNKPEPVKISALPPGVISIGTIAIPADSSSHFVIGSQTLVPGSAPITHSGTVFSLPSSGSGIVIGPSTQPLVVPSVQSVPVITIGSSTLTTDSSSRFYVGSQTLVPGGTVIQGSKTISLAFDASAVIVGSQTQQITHQPVTPTSIPMISIGGSTLTANSASHFRIGSQTLVPGGPAITNSVGQIVSLETGGSSVVVDGQTQKVYQQVPTPAPVITIGGSRITADSLSHFVVGSQTLAPGSNGITVSNQVISLASSGNAVVFGERTQAINAPSQFVVSQAPILTLGQSTITADSKSEYVIAGQTLHAGSSAIVVSRSTISLAPSAAAVVVNGETASLIPHSLLATVAPPIITVGPSAIKPGNGGEYVVTGQTLSAGGSAITVSGTRISLGFDTSEIIIGSSTEHLSPQVLALTTEALVLTLGNAHITAIPTSQYVYGGKIFEPGDMMTISGTIVSLAADDSYRKIGASTSMIPKSDYLFGTQFLEPGHAIAVSGTVISLASDDSYLKIGSSTEILHGHTVTQSTFAKSTTSISARTSIGDFVTGSLVQAAPTVPGTAGAAPSKKSAGSRNHDIGKLAYSRPFKLFLLSIVLFIPVAIILALPSRFAARVSAIAGHVKPFGSSTLRPPSRPLTTAAMAPQTFKKPPQAPPLFTGTPTSILEDTKRLLDKSRALQDKIVAEVKPEDATFESVMLPAAHDENTMALETHIIGFYQSVSTNQELRNASTEAEKQMDDFSIESVMREDMFKVVDGAFQKAQKGGSKLDPESMRLLEKDRKSYIRNGLGLEAGPKRDRFKQIKKRLSELSIVFSKNLNEENGGIWFTPEELDGVPDDVVSGLKKGENENEVKLWLSFKYPDLFPTMKYATNIETRKKVFIENENKLNQNVPIFKESIVLRDEAARLLGYPNHAAFKIEDKMAKTPKTVDDFLGDLRSRLTEGGKKELKYLTELKESDTKDSGVKSDDHYFLWDNRFYDRLMLEKDYSLDQQKIAEYFPLQTSIRGMLEIFETLFGLVFVEVTGENRASISPSGKGDDIVWHPDVQIFSVWDDEGEGNGFVGYLYLDLHPREGKYGHAANFNIQPGYIDEKGNRRYPCTALVCNFSKPTPKKPSLLKHDEVVTLFHELGHGIHDLVSKTIYSRFHGTNTVRDFVEAPSQMLENWCWTPSQLKALSHHYSSLSPEYEAAWKEQSKDKNTQKPDEKLPDELIDNLIKTKHVNDALANLRQLHFGIFDMTVHEPKSHKDIEELKVSELYNKLRKDIVGIDGPEVLGEGYAWGHGEATFGHLIGGYDAGYYGYLSSQVYSADMFFSVFAKDPMNPKEGRRYRHTVLEKGGRQDEMETLKEFLGREPSTESFYKELGLA